MANLTVRWRGELHSIATCLDDARAAQAREPWPDGVIDVVKLLDPERAIHGQGMGNG
jgi:hypothetical protein